MIEKFSGIVIRSIKYNDTFNIVDIYTEQRGKLSCLVPASLRNKRSKVNRLLFQPLTLIGFEADLRPKSHLHYIREAHCAFPFVSLPYNPLKSSIALFMSEFLLYTLRGEGVNEALFNYITHSVRWLDAAGHDYSNFHLVFLIHFARFIGIAPNAEQYERGDYFDLLNGCFVHAVPDHPAFLSSEESSAAFTLLRMRYDNMHLFAMNHVGRGRCLTVMNDYYSLHVPDFPKLKSLEILKNLFE